jgi:hypothetical protein
MKGTCILVISLLCSQVFLAQDVDETKNYVYLFNGSVQYGTIVEQNNGLFMGGKIRVDHNEFSAKEVKFYKGETGFYANVGNLRGGGSRNFAQRERKGKVNLYKLVQTYYSSGGYTPGFGGMGGGYYGGGGMRTSITYYYNKGFGDVKKAIYRNLVVDLSDNRKSMAHLTYYKKAQNAQLGCMLGAFATFIGGSVLMFSSLSAKKPGERTTLAPMYIGFGGGIALGIASAVYAVKKHKHLKAAIDAYNE